MTDRCRAELCPNWTGHGCICEVLDLDPCHVETWVEDLTGEWGWQCFTCTCEGGEYESLALAELAAKAHLRGES
jgi:hypothetical protein